VIPQDADLAKTIDHTLLKPDATQSRLPSCALKRVSTNSPRCALTPLGKTLCPAPRRLPGSGLHGDRLSPGCHRKRVKAFEAVKAMDQGATEIDMVINIGALKARDLETGGSGYPWCGYRRPFP